MLPLHNRVRKPHFVEGRALLRRSSILQLRSLQCSAASDIAAALRFVSVTCFGEGAAATVARP